MTGINQGSGSLWAETNQNLEHKPRIGITKERPRLGQIEELAGVEPNRLWSWRPDLGQTGTDT